MLLPTKADVAVIGFEVEGLTLSALPLSPDDRGADIMGSRFQDGTDLRWSAGISWRCRLSEANDEDQDSRCMRVWLCLSDVGGKMTVNGTVWRRGDGPL